MTFDEYIEARNQVTEPDRRYTVYRHVAFRLGERFGITGFRLAEWQYISYACATRNVEEMIHRNEHSVYFRHKFDGHDVIWVYSRSLRCVVTAYAAEDETMFKLRYHDTERLHRA